MSRKSCLLSPSRSLWAQNFVVPALFTSASMRPHFVVRCSGQIATIGVVGDVAAHDERLYSVTPDTRLLFRARPLRSSNS